jgi:hypothetical protein
MFDFVKDGGTVISDANWFGNLPGVRSYFSSIRTSHIDSMSRATTGRGLQLVTKAALEQHRAAIIRAMHADLRDYCLLGQGGGDFTSDLALYLVFAGIDDPARLSPYTNKDVQTLRGEVDGGVIGYRVRKFVNRVRCLVDTIDKKGIGSNDRDRVAQVLRDLSGILNSEQFAECGICSPEGGLFDATVLEDLKGKVEKLLGGFPVTGIGEG